MLAITFGVNAFSGTLFTLRYTCRERAGAYDYLTRERNYEPTANFHFGRFDAYILSAFNRVDRFLLNGAGTEGL